MSDTLAHVAEAPPRVPDAERTGTGRLIGGYIAPHPARAWCSACHWCSCSCPR